MTWHHPHWKDTKTTSYGDVIYTFAPFTGTEPEPVLPPELDQKRDGETWDEYRVRSRECDAANTLWQAARTRRRLAGIYASARPVWQAYQRAVKAVEAAWSAIREAADNEYRKHLFALLTAHDDLRETARQLDDAIRPAAEIMDRVHGDQMLDLVDAERLARSTGLDLDECIHDYARTDCYWRGPTAKAVEAMIDGQTDLLRRADDLAGNRTDTPQG